MTGQSYGHKNTATHSCNQSYVLDYNRPPNKRVISSPCSHKDAHWRQTRTAVESSPFMELRGHVNSCWLTVGTHRAESLIEKVYQSHMIEALTREFGVFTEAERRFYRHIWYKCNSRLFGTRLCCKDRDLNLLSRIPTVAIFNPFSDEDTTCNNLNPTSTVWWVTDTNFFVGLLQRLRFTLMY